MHFAYTYATLQIRAIFHISSKEEPVPSSSFGHLVLALINWRGVRLQQLLLLLLLLLLTRRMFRHKESNPMDSQLANVNA